MEYPGRGRLKSFHDRGSDGANTDNSQCHWFLPWKCAATLLAGGGHSVMPENDIVFYVGAKLNCPDLRKVEMSVVVVRW
jgi:hypothetical protein